MYKQLISIIKTWISNLVHKTRFCKYLHQVNTVKRFESKVTYICGNKKTIGPKNRENRLRLHMSTS
jgi:hypothetical protein